MIKSVVSAWLLSAVCCVSGGVALQNEYLKIDFNEKSGALTQISSPKQQHTFLNSATGAFLWELHWRDSTAGSSGKVNSSDAKSFRFDPVSRTEAQLTWQDFNVSASPKLSVQATVTLDSVSALSRWKISIKGAGTLKFQEVRFPCVSNLSPQTNEFLAAPIWMGQLAIDPRDKLNEGAKPHDWRYEYPGHASMQCFALYQKDGPGIYFAADDTNAFHKVFTFSGDGKGAVHFALTQLPENTTETSGDYSQSYQAVVGVFTGDWLTAAEIYRGWATNQWWSKESRLQKREKNWARETGLWVWNRGRSSEVIEPALALQKKSDFPVSVMWHWWHGCSYDTGFPEYLPPREGNESFAKALERAHKGGVHAIVYMNQRLWGMTTKSWTDLAVTNYAVIDAAGTIHPEVYNTFTKAPCASVCMGTSFWRNHYAGLTEAAFGLGVDGIYMDQACSSLACYNPSHGHPLGGGTYWMKGFRDMSIDIRNRAHHTKSSAIDLAGEGVGESWLPYLDLMLSLQVSRERYSVPDGWEPIPFFQSVYHPYAIQYGNYASLTMPPYDELWPKESAPKEPLKLLDRKFSQQFYLEQARAFVWGQQPTLANFQESHLRERPEEIAYVLQLAKIRARTLVFLQSGIFLRPPSLNVPAKTIDMSRLSIYAGQKGGLTESSKTVALAIAGAWEAGDGSIGIPLASISNESLTVPLKLNRSMYPLPARGTIYKITATQRKKLHRFEGDIDLTLTLAPREACLLQIGP